MSMLHQHQPVYAYQGSSTDPTPSPHQSYMSGTTATALPVFPRSPITPSLHSSLTSPPTSTSTGDLPRPALYPSSGGYSPVGYTTPPPFVYPPPFVPSIPLYASRYPAPHYAQSYSGPHRTGDRGAQWYFPPDATSQSQSNLDHRSVASRHEDEQPGQTKIVKPLHNPLPTGKSPPQSHFGGPNNLRTEIAPTSLTPSSSTSQTKIAEIPPASEIRRDWHQDRRSYHPNHLHKGQNG
ncbi:hypothetical protein BC827DRAFT_266536 [Russula dissimulans]|nr:hypothetical protein BC827DRAFT_266536 [Russula dissimulans]